MLKNNNTLIAERIKAIRKMRQYSQEELAAMVGYQGKSMISYIENGKVDLSESRILAFANALDVSPEYLVGWTDDPYRSDEEIYITETGTIHIPKHLMELMDAYSKSPKNIQKTICILLNREDLYKEGDDNE